MDADERPVPLGRPAKYWQLTREADRLFPDAYAELSVALIGAMGEAFGEAGVQSVLEARCARQRSDYAARIPAALPLKEKVQMLAQAAHRGRLHGGGEIRKERLLPAGGESLSDLCGSHGLPGILLYGVRVVPGGFWAEGGGGSRGAYRFRRSALRLPDRASRLEVCAHFRLT